MARSPSFGSTADNSIALFRLAFATASGLQSLNLAAYSKSQAHSTKGTRSGISEDIALPYLVGTRFQVLFHSPLGVLFTFPSRYLFTIGYYHVFSLTRWSSQIPTEFHVLRGTQVLAGRLVYFKYGTFTLYGALFGRFFYTQVL